MYGMRSCSIERRPKRSEANHDSSLRFGLRSTHHTKNGHSAPDTAPNGTLWLNI